MKSKKNDIFTGILEGTTIALKETCKSLESTAIEAQIAYSKIFDAKYPKKALRKIHKSARKLSRSIPGSLNKNLNEKIKKEFGNE